MTGPFALRDEESACLSRLTIDRLLAGEQEGLDSARAHLATCARCTARLEEERRLTAASSNELHVARQVKRLKDARSPPRAPWKWGALAAGLLAVVGLGRLALTPQGDEVRLKGGLALEVMRVEAQQARPLAPGERLPTGATLVFRASAPSPSQVVLFSLDQQTLSPLVADVPSPWPVASTAALLPVQAVLSEGAGSERFVLASCPGLSEAEIQTRLLAAYGDARGETRVARAPPEVEGCSFTSSLVLRALDGGP